MESLIISVDNLNVVYIVGLLSFNDLYDASHGDLLGIHEKREKREEQKSDVTVAITRPRAESRCISVVYAENCSLSSSSTSTSSSTRWNALLFLPLPFHLLLSLVRKSCDGLKKEEAKKKGKYYPKAALNLNKFD